MPMTGKIQQEVTVSIAHAYDEVVGRGAPVTVSLPLAASKSVLKVTAGRAACLLAGIQHIWSMQRIARFSAHRLQDIGFAQDWDGSLIRASGGPGSLCTDK